jgi:tetratricopeptide (TPR) repeat protein
MAFGLLCRLLQADDELAGLTRAVEQNPRDVDARLALAAEYARNPATRQESLDQLQRILAIQPATLAAYLHLSMALLEWKNDVDEAELALFQGLKHFPQDSGLHSLMANVHSMQAQQRIARRQWNAAQRKLESAESHYDTAIQSAPSKAAAGAAYLGLGSVFQLRSEFEHSRERPQASNAATAKAYAAYRKAVALDPGLAHDVRELEVALSLPAPRFPKTYSLQHLSVSLEDRLRKLRSRTHNVEVKK